MTATVAVPQHMSALEQANACRCARGHLRAEIADAGADQSNDAARSRASRESLAQMLNDPPACARNTRVENVLGWAHRSGPQVARRQATAAIALLYPDVDGAWLVTQLLLKPVGRLTARERVALGVVLRDRRLS